MSKKKKYETLRASIDGNARFSRTRILSNSDRNIFNSQDIREVNEEGHLCKPIWPIAGTIYCIDFSETFYKRILMYLVPIAFSLRAKYKFRTFVDNSNCIYIATTVSLQEFNTAVDWAIQKCILTLYHIDMVNNNADPLTEVIATVWSAKMIGLV